MSDCTNAEKRTLFLEGARYFAYSHVHVMDIEAESLRCYPDPTPEPAVDTNAEKRTACFEFYDWLRGHVAASLLTARRDVEAELMRRYPDPIPQEYYERTK